MAMLSGGCACGAVRYEIADRDVFDAGYCHCNRCRARTGMPAFAFFVAQAAALRWLSGRLVPAVEEKLGHDVRCAACGGLVCFEMRGGLSSLGLDTLDEPARVSPTFHQCVADAVIAIDDDLPQFFENTISHPSTRASPIA